MRNILKRETAITLVSLIVTVIIMLILAGVAVNFIIGDNGIFEKSNFAKEEYQKQEATEIMNMKINGIQMESYFENQTLPTLQYVAEKLKEDEEIDYVKKSAETGDALSIYTKLKAYPYEFEINSSLQLATMDGDNISDSNSTQIEELQEKISELEEQNKNLNSTIERLEEQNRELTARVEELNNASKKVKMKYLGTYNSLYSNTINVSSYEGYENFTVDNFVIANVSFYSQQGEKSSQRFANMLNENSYNASTGILTIERIVDPSYGWTRTINVSVYLVLGEIEKE